MDSLFISKLLEELCPFIQGAQLQKIHVGNDMVFLKLFCHLGNRWLILCANTSNSAHLSLLSHNPVKFRKVPTGFCMGLRKYLNNSRIIQMEQIKSQRIIRIKLGYSQEIYFLEFRLFGRQPDILLLNSQEKMLLSMRGAKEYGMPDFPPPKKIDNSDMNRSECQISPKTLWIMDQTLWTGLIKPRKIMWENQYYSLENPPFPITEKNHQSFLEAAEIFSENYIKNQLFLSFKATIIKSITDGIARLENTRKAREYDLLRIGVPENFRRDGDILAASLHKIKKGMKSASLEDPYTGKMVQLSLDPALNPARNLEKLYGKGKKAERGRKKILELLEENRRKLDILCDYHRILASYNNDEIDFYAIEEIFEKSRVILGKKQKSKRDIKQKNSLKISDKKPPKKDILMANIGGWDILIGQNARANDRLTFGLAQNHDIFMHIADAPGSHLIIRTNGQKVPDEILEKAAELAAWHSSLKNAGSRIIVNSCLKKAVKKPKNVPPGTVTMINSKSFRVIPKDHLAPENSDYLLKVN